MAGQQKKNRKFARMQNWCKVYASHLVRFKNKMKRMESTLKRQPNNESLANRIKSLKAKPVYHRPDSRYAQ